MEAQDVSEALRAQGAALVGQVVNGAEDPGIVEPAS